MENIGATQQLHKDYSKVDKRVKYLEKRLDPRKKRIIHLAIGIISFVAVLASVVTVLVVMSMKSGTNEILGSN